MTTFIEINYTKISTKVYADIYKRAGDYSYISVNYCKCIKTTVSRKNTLLLTVYSDKPGRFSCINNKFVLLTSYYCYSYNGKRVIQLDIGPTDLVKFRYYYIYQRIDDCVNWYNTDLILVGKLHVSGHVLYHSRYILQQQETRTLLYNVESDELIVLPSFPYIKQFGIWESVRRIKIYSIITVTCHF